MEEFADRPGRAAGGGGGGGQLKFCILNCMSWLELCELILVAVVVVVTVRGKLNLSGRKMRNINQIEC